MNLLKKTYQISRIIAVAAMLVPVPILVRAMVTQTTIPDSPILDIAGWLLFVCAPLSFLTEAADKTLRKQPLPWLTLFYLVFIIFVFGLILGMGWASSLIRPHP